VLPPLLLINGRRLNETLPRNFIVLAMLWLVAQIATDVAHDAAFVDYARGWAKIAFTITAFCSLFLLLNTHRRVMLYAAGVAAGSLVGHWVSPDVYAAGEPWKFGYGFPVTVAIVLVGVWAVGERASRFLMPAAILAGAGVLNIYMGLRSLGGICMLAAIYLGIPRRRELQSHLPMSRSRRFVLACLLVISTPVVLYLYTYSAQVGWLGEDAQNKYETQAVGQFGLLLGGRSEFLGSIPAIIDAPFLGHGSWAKDCTYTLLYSRRRVESGYSTGLEFEDCLIPTHSFLLGSWVEAGIVGAVFWAWVMTLSWRALTKLSGTLDRLTPFVAFVAVDLSWQILFSPYGAGRRFIVPFYVVVMMIAATKRCEARALMTYADDREVLARRRPQAYDGARVLLKSRARGQI